MNGQDLIDLLQGHEGESVRVSLTGEMPAEVRAIAFSEGHVVLMAVPAWTFNELDEAMSALGAALPPLPDVDVSWLQMWEIKDGSWHCKAHGLHSTTPGCPECRVKTGNGWHKSVDGGAKVFCNMHSNRACVTCPKPEEVP